MRIRVDSDLCTGHARCNVVAGEVFDVDDDGFNVLRHLPEVTVAPHLEEQARMGVAACPEEAITVLEE